MQSRPWKNERGKEPKKNPDWKGPLLGGGFNYLLFSLLIGEDSHFD